MPIRELTGKCIYLYHPPPPFRLKKKKKKKKTGVLPFVSKKISIPSRGHFCFRPPPLESLFQRMLVIPPSLKPMNFNYFFLVKNVLEESLIQRDLIILNTAIYCATKEPIDNQTFIHEPTAVVI